MKLSPKQLTAALASLAAANRRAYAAREKIMAHSEAVYGVTPNDIDNDTFIDRCDNGCGNPDGMTAKEFDDSMRDAMKMRGMTPPGEQE